MKVERELDNTVELLGTYGGDETHALSAWTSTSRELTDEKRERIPALLKFLAENEHETPFEKSALHFLVNTDIASHIHILKHRIGVSVNAESARYKEFQEMKCYVPPDWPEYWQSQMLSDHWSAYQTYKEAIKSLVEQYGMDRKRAKESARLFLPYNHQIAADVMFNFRSFIHFQKLRNDEHAQFEIKQIAETMLELIRQTGDFNDSLTAFGY